MSEPSLSIKGSRYKSSKEDSGKANPVNHSKYPTSSSWRSFNSRLLNSIEKQYTGPFTVKLQSILEKYSQQADLGVALKESFHGTEFEVQAPEENSLGTVAGKTQAVMFFENLISQFLSGESFDGAPYIPEYERPDADLQKYTLLVKALKAQRFLFEGFGGNVVVPINHKDDLAFMALCGLIEKHYEKNIFTSIDWKVSQNVSEKWGLNATGTNQNLLATLNEQGPYQSETLTSFQYLNSSLTLYEDKTSILERAIPHLLSRSSFIWENTLFNVNSDEVAAMTDSERVLYLVENQSESLGVAFDFLQEKLYPVGKALPKDFAKDAQELSQLLENQENLKKRHFFYLEEQKRYESRFMQVQEELGYSGIEKPAVILDLYVKMPPVQLNAKDQIQRLLYQTLDSYKRNLFNAAALAEEISDLDSEINQLKKKFEISTQEALNSLDVNPLNQQDVLAVYTYFSMIFSNDDIFPEANLKEKASTVQKLKGAFSKWKSFAKERKSEKAQLDPNTVFQDLINDQYNKLLAEYQPQSESYKYKALNDQDLSAVAAVAREITLSAENGESSALQKFNRLKNLIERALLDDKAFSHSLKTHEGFAPEKVAALTAHIEAAKIFLDSRASQEFNGSIQGILDSVSDSHIRSRIEKSSQKMLEVAKNISVAKNKQAESFSKTLESIVNHEQIENARQGASLVIKRSQNNASEIERLQSEYEERAKNLLNTLKTPGWISSYGGFNEIVRGGSLPQNNNTLDGTDTYSDGYRAFRLFWNTFVESNYPEEANRLLRIPAQTNSPIKNAPEILIEALELQDIQQSIFSLRQDQLRYTVSHNRTLDDKTVDLLQDKTLFQFYQKKYLDTQKNQELSNDAYSQFLPIFVATFTSVGDLFGAERLRSYKSQLLKTLPGAEQTFHSVEKWRRENAAGIQKLNDFLAAQIQQAQQSGTPLETPEQQANFIQATLSKVSSMITDFFGGVGSQIMQGVQWGIEKLLIGSAISSALFMAISKLGLLAGAGILGSISTIGAATLFTLSCVGVLSMNKKAMIDFAQKSLTSMLENIKGFLGMGDYGNENGVLEMILHLMEQSLVNELSSFGKFKDLQHKMNYAFYLNEFFDTLGQMQSDLSTFRERINGLIPNVTSQANFSALSAEVFCRSIKDVFLVVPPEILQRGYNENFLDAVRDYLTAYKILLQDRAQTYAGKKIFPMGSDTNFTLFLKKAPLELQFTSNSSVGKLFDNQARSFRINASSIVPYENINPSNLVKSIQTFRERSEAMLALKDRFDHELRKTLHESRAANEYERPLTEEFISQVENGIVSSLEMVRYGYDLARSFKEMDLKISNDYAEYLKPTGETAQSVMSSKLMKESLSVLKKTASFADALDLSVGQSAVNLLHEFDENMGDFLKTGKFTVLYSEFWQNLNSSFAGILEAISNGYPTIGYPILLEFVENKGFLLPQVIWAYQRSLSESSTENIQTANNSKVLYLTNQALNMVVMPNSRTREFLLSPFFVDQFEKHVINNYANPSLMRYLGRLSQTTADMVQSQSSVPWNMFSRGVNAITGRSQPQIQQQAQQNQAPTLKLRPNQGYQAAQPMSSMQDPRVGLYPEQYDPQGVGVSPQQASAYYGNQLSPDVSQTLQPQQQPLQIAANPNMLSSQSSQQLSTGEGPTQPSMQQQTPQSQVNNQQQRPVDTTNPMLPMMMAQSAYMMNQQNMYEQQQLPTTEIEIPQNTGQAGQLSMNMVGVGANGNTFGYTAPANEYFDYPDTPRMPTAAAEAAPPPAMPIARNIPRPEPSFPEPAATPYTNMSTANYEPVEPIPQTNWNFGMNWQTAGAAMTIGAGAAMGAALLAQSVKKKRK